MGKSPLFEVTNCELKASAPSAPSGGQLKHEIFGKPLTIPLHLLIQAWCSHVKLGEIGSQHYLVAASFTRASLHRIEVNTLHFLVVLLHRVFDCGSFASNANSDSPRFSDWGLACTPRRRNGRKAPDVASGPSAGTMNQHSEETPQSLESKTLRYPATFIRFCSGIALWPAST